MPRSLSAISAAHVGRFAEGFHVLDKAAKRTHGMHYLVPKTLNSIQPVRKVLDPRVSGRLQKLSAWTRVYQLADVKVFSRASFLVCCICLAEALLLVRA